MTTKGQPYSAQILKAANDLDARAYLAAIVDSSDDAIVGKNLDGTIVTWNFAAEKIFGYSAQEIIGKHITTLIPADRQDEEFIIIGKIKAGQRVDHFETIRQRKDGSPIEISLTVSPIKNSEGKIIGASKIARDISEQNRIKEILNETSRRKDEFLANMSHELRTPMNAVIGLANILSSSQTLTLKERHYLETLKQSADGLMMLINNILDFSKLDTDAMELEEVEFSLPDLVQRTVDLVKFKAEEKGLSLNVNYAPLVKRYYLGDPLRLQQILTNLVSNAIKFTDKGKVDIAVSSEKHSNTQSVLTITVSDTGMGIAPDKLPIIFDKFIQADASTSRKYGGSGLGLSIAKGFAEKMGGTVTATSVLGVGSAFKIIMPLENSARVSEIETESEENVKKQKNILIVDDYLPNILVMSAMVEQMGYDYDVAENGIEAIREFNGNKYGVILMDVQMHGMDGYESTRRIRAIEHAEKRTRTPIIAITAHVRESDKQQCLASGMDDFIPKPFNRDLLEQKLKALIKEKAA